MDTELQPRRKEFSQDRSFAYEVLDRARSGALATVDEQGAPELRPLNFVRRGETLYFHTSPKSRLARRQGRASFTAQCDEAWLPSYWRDERLACPATTYYSSVVAHGVLEPVTTLQEKAEALEAFMQRYQSEGGYTPLSDPVYRGPLDALSVQKMSLETVACKAKYGQHLNQKQRTRVYEALLERRLPGDLAAAAQMRRWNADLPAAEGWTHDPLQIDPGELFALLKETYWGHRRSPEICARMLREATLITAYHENGRLICYSRFHRLDPRTGMLYDVIVRPSHRGRGLSKEMVSRVLGHSAAALERILLDTRDAQGLYEQFGFSVIDRAASGSFLMIRYS